MKLRYSVCLIVVISAFFALYLTAIFKPSVVIRFSPSIQFAWFALVNNARGHGVDDDTAERLSYFWSLRIRKGWQNRGRLFLNDQLRLGSRLEKAVALGVLSSSGPVPPFTESALLEFSKNSKLSILEKSNLYNCLDSLENPNNVKILKQFAPEVGAKKYTVEGKVFLWSDYIDNSYHSEK